MTYRRGRLFSEYFLSDGVRQLPGYASIGDAAVASLDAVLVEKIGAIMSSNRRCARAGGRTANVAELIGQGQRLDAAAPLDVMTRSRQLTKHPAERTSAGCMSSRQSDQAVTDTLARRRAASPVIAKPAISSPQVAGSGTPATASKVTVPGAPRASIVPE